MHTLSKIGVGFPTFVGASYSKPYRVGIYTLSVELQITQVKQ